MRAFAIKEFGQPGDIVEVPAPQAGEGEVLVRVRTASVNPMDAYVASGGTRAYAETRTPLVPGIDAAGVVEAVGPGGNGFQPGDAVVLDAGVKAFWGEGTFAELVAVPSAAVAHKPSGLSDEEASTIPLAGLTALGVADQLDAGPGKVIAVIGSTGGVGGWFTQIAARRGATLVALVKPENADYARDLGAVDVIDYTEPASLATLAERYPDGIDAIADFSGSTETIERVAKFGRRGGVLVSVGMTVDPAAWTQHGLEAQQGTKADRGRLGELVQMLASGELRAPEIRVLRLQDAADALAEVAERHTRGKLVLTVSHSS